MPNHEKVLRKTHSVLSASVMPTTQADILPTKWKRVSLFSNQQLSSTFDFYAVRIIGEAYSFTTSQSRDVEVQRVYSALHPTCAIGRAVMEFFKDNCRATITHIEILKGEIL
jgi:hypothetical protein